MVSVFERLGLLAVDSGGEPIQGQSCVREQSELSKELTRHLRADPLHVETAQLVDELVREMAQQGKSVSGAASTELFLARQIAFNETMVFSNAVGGEIGLLASAVPEYSMFASSQQSTSNVQNVGQWVKSAVSFVVKGFQSVKQWFQTHAEGPATYYKVSLYAPYMYGLVQMVLIGLFPVAALWALWPGHWKALLNFGKLFLSVKLWMVFWSILAAFNQARYDLVLGNDPARNGIGNQIEIFPSICAMYLLTPLLSYMIVSLATSCGALALQGLIPGARSISGIQDLHKEAKEIQSDIKGVVDGARAGAQAAMGGGPSALASGSGASDSSTPFRTGSGENTSAGEGSTAGGQAAAV